ncbi:hypothetical protein AB1046_00490 [Promicromonospora sp. Populi]|uniref:hypothetical protein n=1 Tax=Promicromonospora sp. Populi TaxID=3239420 RepID=UPI0034E1A091
MADGELTAAIVLWTGRECSDSPTRDSESVIRDYGDSVGRTLLARILEIEEAFYKTSAHAKVSDLAAMGEQAAADFRPKHPEVGEEAVQALAWCYTFDYR